MRQEIRDFINKSIEKLDCEPRGDINFGQEEKFSGGKIEKIVQGCISKVFNFEDRAVLVVVSPSYRENDITISLSISHTKTKESIIKGIKEIVLCD